MDGINDHIFFKVTDIKFGDLYDWANPLEKCRTHTTSIPGRRLQRQDSRAGSLVDLNETKVALFRVAEKVYAINEKCPHLGGPLHVGDIEMLPDRSLCVRCPWHSWRFDLTSGDVKHPKGHNKQAIVYPVEVRDKDTLWIGFRSFSDKYFTGDFID